MEERAKSHITKMTSNHLRRKENTNELDNKNRSWLKSLVGKTSHFLDVVDGINKSKVSVDVMTSIRTQRRLMKENKDRLNTDWIQNLLSPLMKNFNLAARQLCVWPSAVTSGGISSREGEHTSSRQINIHWRRRTNLHEIWLPFINQDAYAPVHRHCLPSKFVVSQITQQLQDFT